MRMYFSLLVQCVWTQVPLRLGNTFPCCPNSHPGFLIKTHHAFCVKHFFKNRAGCIFCELCEDIDSYCADHPKIQSWVCLPIKEMTQEFSALDVWGRPDQKKTHVLNHSLFPFPRALNHPSGSPGRRVTFTSPPGVLLKSSDRFKVERSRCTTPTHCTFEVSNPREGRYTPLRPPAPHLLEIVVFHELLKFLNVANRHQVLLHMRQDHKVIWGEKVEGQTCACVWTYISRMQSQPRT